MTGTAMGRGAGATTAAVLELKEGKTPCLGQQDLHELNGN